MPNGYGKGFGRWGGGLPRCGYFLSGAWGAPVWPVLRLFLTMVPVTAFY